MDKHDILYVVFAAYAEPSREEKVFSWKEMLIGEGNVLSLYDFNRSWYQTCRNHVIRQVSSSIYKFKPRKKVFVGASQGGYAALACSVMFGAHAIAFAPQTILCPTLLHPSALKNYNAMIEMVGKRSLWMIDLAPYANENMSIWYDSKHRVDSFHAERMGSLVNLMPIAAGCGHGIGQYLKRNNLLRNILIDPTRKEDE